MPIPVTCKACSATFQVLDDFAGKRGRCPQCGEVVLVPASAPPPERREEPRPISNPSTPDRGRPDREDRPRDEDSRERERDRDDRRVRDDRRDRKRDRYREDDRDWDRDRDRNRERDRDRDYDDFDYEAKRNDRKARKIGYNWRNAASGVTSHMVGCIMLGVASLALMICEFQAFSADGSSRPSPGQEIRIRRFAESLQNVNPRQPFNQFAEPPVGALVQLIYIINPVQPIVMLVALVLAMIAAVFLATGHSRFGTCPERRFAGLSRIGVLLCWLAAGGYALSFVLGFMFLIMTSGLTFLIAMPFYVSAIATLCLLTGQLLLGIATMHLGGRYYSGLVKWYSLGVWIAFSLLNLLLLIFVLTTISNALWAGTFAKIGTRGIPNLGFIGMGGNNVVYAMASSNGVYVTFLIIGLMVSVAYIFPLTWVRGLLLTGEPPAAPPPRRLPPPRPRYDDYDDRVRERERDRDRDRDRYYDDDRERDRDRDRRRDDDYDDRPPRRDRW